MASRQEVRVPDLGDFEDVEIVEVMVAVGDHVALEDPLITLETDKAAMEVPATAAGQIVELPVATGMRVSQGDLIVVVETEAGAATADQDEPAADSAAAEEQAAGAAATATVQVLVPDLGDFPEAEIIEVQAQVGDSIAIDDPVITLETDKAAMDVPSTAAGKITAVAVEVGQSVGQGALILEVESSGAAAAPVAEDKPASAATAEPTVEMPRPAPQPQPAAAPAQQAPRTLPPIDEVSFGKAHASPAVRRFARELGVNLAQVTGTGQKSRVLKEDVMAFVKSVMTGQAAGPAGAGLPELPRVDFAKFGAVEVKPLSRIQKISGPRLHASWVNYPHVTQHDEADLTELEERRQKLKGPAKEKGVSLTPLAFIIKATSIALEEFPVFNTSMADDGKSLVWKQYMHIGFAADTPNGLIVPVIRDVDKKDVMSIAEELGELSALGREGKLKAEQMQGGTFTVSSLGGIGGTHFTPIINPPEVAILGVGRSQMRAVWRDEQFVPRLILPMSLSYDHRIIDGATGVRFTTYLAGVLADVDRLMLG